DLLLVTEVMSLTVYGVYSLLLFLDYFSVWLLSLLPDLLQYCLVLLHTLFPVVDRLIVGPLVVDPPQTHRIPVNPFLLVRFLRRLNHQQNHLVALRCLVRDLHLIVLVPLQLVTLGWKTQKEALSKR